MSSNCFYVVVFVFKFDFVLVREIEVLVGGGGN